MSCGRAVIVSNHYTGWQAATPFTPGLELVNWCRNNIRHTAFLSARTPLNISGLFICHRSETDGRVRNSECNSRSQKETAPSQDHAGERGVH
ncbi:hypothetical protein TNCV_3289691 [Trichonephila clavipes]|nr:hypothetical protein TNCV_3289691 [Trichonephila clavipes]